MKRYALLTVMLAVSLTPGAAGADKADDLRTAVAPPGWARGDYDAALSSLAGVIERNADSPVALVALAGLRRTRWLAKDDAKVTERLLALVRKGVADGENDEALRRYLRSRLRELGRFDEAEGLEPDRGYVTSFAVVGPFGFSAQSLLHKTYEVERTLDLGKAYADGLEERRFTVRPATPGTRWVDPFDALESGSGVAYALAQVRSVGSRPALLKVVTGGSLTLFVNAARALSVDRLRHRLPRTTYVPVALREGWNRILVKTAGSGADFSLMLADPESTKPLEGVEIETDLVLHDVAPAPAEPPTAPGRRLPHERLEGDGPWADAAAGVLLAEEGLHPESLAAFADAARNGPGEAAIQHHLGAAYRNAPHLPEVWRNNQAKTAFQAALSADPDFTPSAIELALLKHADDKSEEAVAELRALAEKHPEHLAVLHALSRVCGEKGWEKEALDAARGCLDVSDRFRPALMHLVDYYERYGNTTEAKKLLLRAVEADAADYDAIDRLSDLLADAGDRKSSLDQLRRLVALRPDQVGSRLALARALEHAGETDEALAILESIEARHPLDPMYPQRIGDLLRRRGDVAGALERYRRCLELAPAQGTLRRYVARLTGGEEDVARVYEPEVLDLVKSAPGREEFPRAPAVCLLDHMVTRVWDDGSSTDVIHMAFKLLDEKGVEKYGRVNTSGETLEIRTIDPEGRIFEPLGVRHNTFNMPALAPGSVVEYRFRMEQRRDPRWLDTESFYFRDPEFENAVLLSRWVVILPKKLRAQLMMRNYEGKHEVEEKGDLVVHTFEVRNSPRTEQEPYMPDGDEFLPWVRFYRNRPLDDLNYAYADRLWQGLSPTPRVEDDAAEVTDGIEGNIAKARALYEHVNEVVTGGGGFGGPTATLLEKAGDRFELLASLMIAAGVEFEFGMACPDRGEDVMWEIVSPGHFQQRCMRVPGEDGEEAWVFVDSRFMPFGRVPDRYRDSPVYLISEDEGRIVSLPAEREELHVSGTTTSIRLSADPAKVTAEVTYTDSTDFAYRWKERLRDLDADERRQQAERWLASRFTGPVLTDYELVDLEQLGTPAEMRATATLPNFLRPENDGFRASLGIRTLDLAHNYVGKPERIHPMDIRQEASLVSRTTIDLGGAYRVKSLPPGHTTLGPLGSYSLTVEEDGDRIVVEREVRQRRCRLTRDEYREFVLWVKAIDEAEGREILLTRRP